MRDLKAGIWCAVTAHKIMFLRRNELQLLH